MNSATSDISGKAVVLVADDEALLRAYIAEVLLDADFSPVEAGTADEAFEILQAREDIDAVLTDVEMPGSLDGLRLAQLTRRCWPHIAIVVMSGRPLPAGHELPERSIFHPKPCDTPALLAQIHELIAVSHPLRPRLA